MVSDNDFYRKPMLTKMSRECERYGRQKRAGDILLYPLLFLNIRFLMSELNDTGIKTPRSFSVIIIPQKPAFFKTCNAEPESVESVPLLLIGLRIYCAGRTVT